MRIKLIKALMGIITILLSYRFIKYLLYWNKLILYLLGLLFVGFNWNDYKFLNEIKLIWDSIKLYFLNLLPENEKVNEIKVSTKKDMNEIINYKDHTNLNNEISDDYIYVIADKIPEVKSIRSELKESVIYDGNGNSWTFNEFISNPLVLFAIATAVFVSGMVIIDIYDLSLDQITSYTWTHIKMGFVSIVLFLGKIIRFFNSKPPRPPMNPSNDPIDLNPKLVAQPLDFKGKAPMVITKDELPIASSSKQVHFGPEKPPFFDVIQSNDNLKHNQNILNKITEINANIKELNQNPMDNSNIDKIKFLSSKIDELKDKVIDLSPIDSTGSITPTQIKSPIMDNSDLPMVNPFKDI